MSVRAELAHKLETGARERRAVHSKLPQTPSLGKRPTNHQNMVAPPFDEPKLLHRFLHVFQCEMGIAHHAKT